MFNIFLNGLRTATILIALGLPALAEAQSSLVTLLCDTGRADELGPTTIVLDESARTAILIGAGVRNDPYPPLPGATHGPVVATFEAQHITFTITRTDYDTAYSINRMTGVLMARVVIHTAPNNRQLDYSWRCRVGERQF